MGKRILINVALVLTSLLLVLGIAVAADRMLGAPVVRDYGNQRMALLFNPGVVEHVKTVEFSFTARMNNLGLRDNDVSPGKSNRFRIVAIGDSFTHAWGVELEQSWVKQLETELTRRGYDVEVINAGRNGMGSAHYPGMAKRVVPVLQPDLVLIGMLHNDLGISHMERVGLWRPITRKVMQSLFPNLIARREQRALEAEQAKVPAGVPPELSEEHNRKNFQNIAKDTVSRFLPNQRERFDAMDQKLRDLYLNGDTNPFMISVAVTAPLFYSSLLDLRQAGWQEVVPRVGKYLTEVRAIAARHGAATFAAIIPAGPYCNRPQWQAVKDLGFEVREEMLASDTPDALTREACGLAGIPCVSVTAEMREHMDEPGLYYPLDNHFSAKGHALYAKYLAEQLKPHLKEALRSQPSN